MPVALFLDAAVTLFKRYRWLVAVVPLALALAVQSWRLSGVKHDLTTARTQIAQMQLASGQARRNQQALNATNQELSQRIATDATVRHAQLAAASDAAIADYVRSHRVRSDSSCIASGPGVAPMRDNPGSPVDPGTGSDMVAVPRTEFEQVARAAVQGGEATSFLIDRVNAGLAVPASEVPSPSFGAE